MKYLTLLLIIGLAFSTTINIPADYTTIQERINGWRHCPCCTGDLSRKPHS